MIIYTIILHALNFIHAFTKDCSIRVTCGQFTITISICFIRVVAIVLMH